MKEQISTKEQIRRYKNFLRTVKKYIEEQENEQRMEILREDGIPSSETKISNLYGRYTIIDGFIPAAF